MGAFQNISIRWKLKLIIMLTSGIALLFASAILMYRDIMTSRKSIRNDLSSLAQVIGRNSIGAVVFNDQQTAENNLSALNAKPFVMLASIYDRRGKVFAVYIHEDAKSSVSVPTIRDPGYYYEGNHLLVFTPILQENDVIGTVCIQYDLKYTQVEMLQSAGIFGIVVLLAFMITWLLSSSLQKVISRPILSLTEIARAVSEKKDFSVRAEKHSRDEIGVLIDVFNDMLAAIQSRDNKLQEYREHLEEQVAARTMALRQTNRALQSAKEAAESANRAKSDFLANISHEIRTPMNAVLGFADLLNSLITDKKQKNYLASISSSGKNLLNLINGILDLSKIEAGKMELEYEPVDLRRVFDEIQRIFALQASEKKIDFVITIAKEIPEFLILDEVRLKQILFNLIGNAVKFTEKGYVRISVADEDESRENDAYIDLMISVEDTGIGIPHKYHKEIFEAFRQKDGQSTKRFGGTGLGLSITKRLVEMMGGGISVQSRENVGSRFALFLPQVKIAHEARAEIRDTFDPTDVCFEKATLLIVDDLTSNRLLIKEYLAPTQVAVIEAENGEDAVQLTKLHMPDVVLMDLRMPVMTGIEAMRQIGMDKEIASIPVVALTASGMSEEKEELVALGFAGYLIKPITKDVLFKELTKFIVHSHLTEKGSAPEDAQFPVRPEILTEVISQLENKYMQLWAKTKQNLFFEDIDTFAGLMQELGDRYALDILKNYGTDLSANVKNFDVELMNSALNAYPRIIEKIRSYLHQKKETINELGK